MGFGGDADGSGQRSFQQLSSEKDYEETAAFFKKRDTSQYDMALKQTLENIQARAAWIKVCLDMSSLRSQATDFA